MDGLRFYAMLALPRNSQKKVPLKVMFGGGEAYLSENLFRSMLPGKNSTPLELGCAVLFFHLPHYAPVVSENDAPAEYAPIVDVWLAEHLKKLL